MFPWKSVGFHEKWCNFQTGAQLDRAEIAQSGGQIPWESRTETQRTQGAKQSFACCGWLETLLVLDTLHNGWFCGQIIFHLDLPKNWGYAWAILQWCGRWCSKTLGFWCPIIFGPQNVPNLFIAEEHQQLSATKKNHSQLTLDSQHLEALPFTSAANSPEQAWVSVGDPILRALRCFWPENRGRWIHGGSSQQASGNLESYLIVYHIYNMSNILYSI